MDRRKRAVVGPQKSKFTPVRRTTHAAVNRRQSVPTMDKHSMLVMEANEIAQYLKKHYVFEMKGDSAGDESQIHVRVRNTETKLVCVWTLAKTKERLQKMRKLMYADEAEGQGIGGDTVFFDAADIWLPEEELKESTNKPTNTDKTDTNPPNHNGLNRNSSPVLTKGLSHRKSSPFQSTKPQNGHSYNAVNHSNRSDSHSNGTIRTLSREDALPSVSVSVALQATQDTIKLPNGMPEVRAGNQSNGLLSTASSELPADSEFFSMSMTSTLNSPMSPPPPPKDFGENSGRAGASVNQPISQTTTPHGALPEKYLTSSSGSTSSESRVSSSHRVRQGGKSPNISAHETKAQHAEHTGPGDPNLHPSHRPIIKSRSPNVTAAPGALKNSRKMRTRDGGLSFTMESNSKTSQNTAESTRIQTRDNQPIRSVPRDLGGNKSQLSNDERKIHQHPSQSRRDLPHTRDSVDKTPATHSDKRSSGAFTSQSQLNQPNPCPHCHGGQVGASTDAGGRDMRTQRKGKRTISSLRICRDMVKTLSYRCKGPMRTDSLADRIMYNCESVKLAVINMLEAYTQAQDSKQDMASFADSEVVRLTSLQLVAAMELLVSHASLWCTALQGGDQPDVVRESCNKITGTVRDLGKEMVLFLQACETDNDSVATDSFAKITDQLYELLHSCGQLALATGACPAVLVDRQKQSALDDLLALKHHRDDDLLNLKPGADVKQGLLGGCDAWLQRCTEASVKNIQDCEMRAQMLSEDCYASQESGMDVAKHVYITTTTTKILLLKCQEVQVDITTTMKDDCAKEENYFEQYFVRCQGMLQHLSTLVDSVALLCQAAEPLVDEEDPSTLRKISRCSEMIYKATNKLVTASNFDLSQAGSLETPRSTISGVSMETRNEDLELSVVISDTQCEQIDHCGEDVKLATQALCTIVKRRLPNDSLAGSKVKRMLPATPGGASGGARQPMMRCKSAKNPDRMRRSISYYDVGKKSNEV